MIELDVTWTTRQMPGYNASVQALAAEIRRLRADLGSILRTGDQAARGATLASLNGRTGIFIEAEHWERLRRAQVTAANNVVGPHGLTN